MALGVPAPGVRGSWRFIRCGELVNRGSFSCVQRRHVAGEYVERHFSPGGHLLSIDFSQPTLPGLSLLA